MNRGPLIELQNLLKRAPVPTADPHTFYPLTLAEAEKKAGFALQSPSVLSETFSFTGAKYDLIAIGESLK